MRSDERVITADKADQDAAEREGHSQRVERLFREHNDSLIRFLNARLHCDAEARELAQEAYVRLLKLDEPGAVSYLRAFLFRTAANLAQDRLKQRSRRGELRELVFFGADNMSPSVEAGVEAVQTLAILRRAIDDLPPKCQTAFLLHRIHGESVSEVADRMHLSVRMVRLYVARAFAHFRARLDDAG